MLDLVFRVGFAIRRWILRLSKVLYLLKVCFSMFEFWKSLKMPWEHVFPKAERCLLSIDVKRLFVNRIVIAWWGYFYWVVKKLEIDIPRSCVVHIFEGFHPPMIFMDDHPSHTGIPSQPAVRDSMTWISVWYPAIPTWTCVKWHVLNHLLIVRACNG